MPWSRGGWAASLAVAALLAMPALAPAGNSMAVQPDGKIVLAGTGGGAIVRLNPDGTLDTGFGFGGGLLDFRGGGFGPIAVQPSGRIVVAGGNGVQRDVGYRLRGFQPDGDPDLEFGEGGIAVGPAVEPDRTTTPSVIQARPDGGLIVGGSVFRYIKFSGSSRGVAQLFGQEGSFGGTVGEFPRGGQAELGNTWLSDLLQRPDGSLVAVGSSEEHLGSRPRVLLGRFLPGSGAPYDPSFAGGAGFALFDPPGVYPELSAANAVVATEGRLVLAGTAQNRVLVVGFEEGGNLDTAFGEDGFTVAPLDGSMFAEASAAVVQADGKIVVAGKTWDACASEPALGCWSLFVARFNQDGSIDTSFGFDGFIRLPTRGEVKAKPNSIDVALSGDGKILLSEETPPGPSSPGHSLLTVARFTSNGNLDPSFGAGGIASATACPGTLAELRKTGCLSSARVRLRAGGLRSGRPRLRLRVESTGLLDPLRNVQLMLPRALETREKGISRRIKVGAVGAKPASVIVQPRKIRLWRVGRPRSVSLVMPAGTLRATGRIGRARKLAFHVRVWFQDGSEQAILLRR